MDSVAPVNGTLHTRRMPPMHIDVFFSDRVDIAQEILATLAQRALDVAGVQSVDAVAMLPGARRR